MLDSIEWEMYLSFGFNGWAIYRSSFLLSWGSLSSPVSRRLAVSSSRTMGRVNMWEYSSCRRTLTIPSSCGSPILVLLRWVHPNDVFGLWLFGIWEKPELTWNADPVLNILRLLFLLLILPPQTPFFAPSRYPFVSSTSLLFWLWILWVNSFQLSYASFLWRDRWD